MIWYWARNMPMRIAGSTLRRSVLRRRRAQTKVYATSVCIVSIVLVSLMGLATSAPQPPFQQWVRLNHGNPIMAPKGDGFESAGVFNPAVVKKDGKFVMLYRAQDKA